LTHPMSDPTWRDAAADDDIRSGKALCEPL
jgi:hypothetical protein